MQAACWLLAHISKSLGIESRIRNADRLIDSQLDFTQLKNGWVLVVLTKENFYAAFDLFRTLPVQISSCIESSFRQAYGDDSAGLEKNIVYVFRSAKPVPRLKGLSDILYIGQTKGTFRGRYLQYAKLHASSNANSLKFKHILSEYGPIRIEVASYEVFGESLLKAEGQLLWWYFQNHCEYPPLNYTRTKIRNDSLHVCQTAAP